MGSRSSVAAVPAHRHWPTAGRDGLVIALRQARRFSVSKLQRAAGCASAFQHTPRRWATAVVEGLHQGGRRLRPGPGSRNRLRNAAKAQTLSCIWPWSWQTRLQGWLQKRRSANLGHLRCAIASSDRSRCQNGTAKERPAPKLTHRQPCSTRAHHGSRASPRRLWASKRSCVR